VSEVTLGKKIRALRDELGMSQAQLASQAELSQGYLSQLENDEVQNPSAAVIFRLARSLHVDPRILMQAAGYPDLSLAGETPSQYQVSVDPDLLSFLARIPREQQARLLKVFQGMQRQTSEPAGGRS
jgi:transcriptional regulator with XRE-family HTH domain